MLLPSTAAAWINRCGQCCSLLLIPRLCPACHAEPALPLPCFCAQLIRKELKQCYKEAGVNHQQKCRDLAQVGDAGWMRAPGDAAGTWLPPASLGSVRRRSPRPLGGAARRNTWQPSRGWASTAQTRALTMSRGGRPTTRPANDSRHVQPSMGAAAMPTSRVAPADWFPAHVAGPFTQQAACSHVDALPVGLQARCDSLDSCCGTGLQQERMRTHASRALAQLSERGCSQGLHTDLHRLPVSRSRPAGLLLLGVALVPLSPVVRCRTPVCGIAPVEASLLLRRCLGRALDDDGGCAGGLATPALILRDWLRLPPLAVEAVGLRPHATAAGPTATHCVCRKGRQRMLLNAHLSVHFRRAGHHAVPLQGGRHPLPAPQQLPQGGLHLPSQPEACQPLGCGLVGSLPCCQRREQEPLPALLPGGFVLPVPRCRWAVQRQQR